MIRINIRHAFPLSAEEAFGYITNLSNWPQYWPDFIRLEELGAIDWGSEGARVKVVIKLLGRETAMDIVLQRFVTNALVKYVSRQKGLPEIRHQRHFEDAPGGCEFRLVMEYEPRRGLKGLFDRTLLRLSIVKAIRKTLRNLDNNLAGYATSMKPANQE